MQQLQGSHEARSICPLLKSSSHHRQMQVRCLGEFLSLMGDKDETGTLDSADAMSVEFGLFSVPHEVGWF